MLCIRNAYAARRQQALREAGTLCPAARFVCKRDGATGPARARKGQRLLALLCAASLAACTLRVQVQPKISDIKYTKNSVFIKWRGEKFLVFPRFRK